MILCAVLGALLGLSFKSRDAIRRQGLPAANYPALSQEYLMVKHSADDERLTIAALQKKVSEYASGTASDSKQEKALLDDLNQSKFQAGLTEVTGPGIIVTLKDSKNYPPGAPKEAIELVMVHDNDINQTVDELKAGHAEAISVNDQRLIATSPVRCAGPIVNVNGTPATPPFVIRAIGDPKVLEDTMNLPGGVGDSLRRIDPAMFAVQKAEHLVIPAYVGATQPKYAKPVAAGAAQ